MSLMEKIFGNLNAKEVKKLEKIAEKVEALDEETAKLSDDELRAKTDEFKGRLAEGETLDDLLPEAFAVCREAAVRSLGMKHFHVQIIGGIVLHQGRIAEMKTGEGKTLMATLPVYLNALSGDGVSSILSLDSQLVALSIASQVRRESRRIAATSLTEQITSSVLTT